MDTSESLYATYDPFDYMYSPTVSSQLSDPIYAAVIKTPINSPPPLPPRSSLTPKESKVINITRFLFQVKLFMYDSTYNTF